MGQLLQILQEITIGNGLPKVFATDENSEFYKIQNFPLIDISNPLGNLKFKNYIILPILKYNFNILELNHIEKYQDSYFNFDINKNTKIVILQISGDFTWYFTSDPINYFTDGDEIMGYQYNIELK